MMYLDTDGQWDMLSNEQAGILIKALFKYSKSGEVLETEDGMLKMAFSFMAAQLDRDNEKYNRICERNSINGAKGGRPKKQTVFEETEKTQSDISVFEKPKKANKNKNTNKNNNKNNNIYNTEQAPSSERSLIDSMLSEYTKNDSLITVIKDYAKFRKAIKAPLTERALRICLNKLNELADTDEQKIAVVEQSIERGWKGLFPLKDSKDTAKEKTDEFDSEKYNFVINNF